MIKILLIAAFGFATISTAAQQPWQKIQMPTVAEVEATWMAPPPEYGPQPYFVLNGAVDATVVRRDLDELNWLGFQAVTVQCGFATPFEYLSPEYFRFFKMLLAEVKKRDMRMWIVDDAGYPSGFAGGKFTTLKPGMRMQALVAAQRIAAKTGDRVKQAVTPATVAVTAVKADGSTVAVPFHGGAIDWTAPAGIWQVVVVEHQFKTSPTRSDTNTNRVKDTSQSLEDYLDPAATKQFLEFTHEQYKREVGDEFGKTILGFRGDEPDYSISGLPWTPALFDRFQNIKGYDVRPYIASFFLREMAPSQKRAKADYWDVFSAMFRDGFFKIQGDWCAANHLEYQVHLNHEEREMELVRSEGDFFRDMRYVQVPGIDAIWHQIWTDTISDFPRLASSAAHVYGKPRAFTESFAAYRPMPNIEIARYVLNEQFVRGINLVEIMNFPATSAGMSVPAFMTDPGFPDLMRYTRRLSYLMSMGRPAAEVALYLPSSSMWLNDEAADKAFVATEQLLSEHQIDFDIVDKNALARELIPGAGTLQTLSGNRFRTVMLPGTSLISEAALDRLHSFAAGGGRVLFLGCTPSLIFGRTILHARPATSADFSWAYVEVSAQLPPTPTPPAYPPPAAPAPQIIPPAIMQAVNASVTTRDVALDTPDIALRYLRRRLKDADVYLFFNEGAAASRHVVTLMSEAKKAEVWDPQTGHATGLASTRRNGALQIDMSLKPYEARLIVVR